MQKLQDYLRPFATKEPYNPRAFSNARLRAKVSRYAAGVGDNIPSEIAQLPTKPAAPESKMVSRPDARPRSAMDRGTQKYAVPPSSGQTSCPGNLFNLDGNRTGPVQKMGCWMLPDSEIRSSRAMIDTIEGVPGAQPSNIVITEPPQQGYPSEHGPSRTARSVMSPSWNRFDPSHYREPVLDSERRVSSGVMVNAYTGKTYECFEDELPPPTIDQEIPAEQLQQTNPKLVWALGGRDPNRVAPNKKEVCQDLPRVDDGPNVWGPQLYADRIRSETQTRINRDLWSNRNGDFSVEAVDDRKPVGYVGFQPATRFLPYMPATQRNATDNLGYTPIPEDQVPGGSARDVIFPRITIKKPDLTQCPRALAVDASNGNVVEQQVLPSLQIPDTNRQTTGVHSVPGASDAGAAGQYVLSNTEVRDTLKTEMEGHFASANAQESEAGGYVVQDVHVRDTLKVGTEDRFPTANGNGTAVAGGYVVQDTELRDTLKAQMQRAFPGLNAHSESQAGHVVLDTHLRETLKAQMQSMFPTTNAGSSGHGAYVVTDTEVRATLKSQMEAMFPELAGENQMLADGGGGYVMNQNPEDLRETTKGLMATMFAPSNAASDTLGAYAVSDREVRDTLKRMMETAFAPQNVSGDSAGAQAGYVMNQDPVHLRATLKGLMASMFPNANAARAETGDYIPFQGSVLPTHRSHYETQSGRPSVSAEGVGNVQPLEQRTHDTVDPHRGTCDPHYVPALSHVPAATEDTSAIVMGQQTKQTAREQQNRFPLPTSRSLQETLVVPGVGGAEDRASACAEQWRYLTPDYYTEGQAAGGM